jgi:hypothetical protein
VNIPHLKKWVKALRSGKYNQTQSVLHDNDGFCCLGVACDIKDPDGWQRSIAFDSANLYQYRDSEGDIAKTVLSPNVAEWLGFEGLYKENPFVNFGDSDGDANSMTLGDLNDAGYSFEFIAQVIEDNFIN